MLGYPIDPRVQKTLNERKQVLKKNKNPYELTKGKNPSQEIQKNIVRTPYISMLSSPKLISPTGDLDNSNFPDPVQDVILSNQEYTGDIDAEFSPINYGLNLYSTQDKIPFRPKPGVVSLTSEYQSTSNVYFVRDVSVSWRCHSLEDLERLSYRFLTLNRLVYVEWGWNYADKPPTTFITSENLKKISNPKLLREEVIKAGQGNFDAVLGYVSNFEWSANGMGFDCRTDIVSQGSDILSQRIGDDIATIKEDADNPNLEDAVIGENTIETTEFDATTAGQYSPGRRVKKTETKNIVGQKGKTFIEKNVDGSVNIETERGLRFTESFKFVINNLEHSVQKLLSSQKGKDISKTTLYANEVEVKEKYADLQKEKDLEYDEIENKVREEYNNNDFSNWKNGVKGFGIGADGRIKREADRRFREQNGDTSYNRIFSNQAQITRQQKAQELNSETTRDRNQTITKQIKYDKNLIQTSTQTNYQYSNTDTNQKTGVKVDGPDKYITTETSSKDTWVRWGWFEDNILSKFFGLVTQGGEPILQIRSIRNVLKTGETTEKGPNGEEIKENSRGQNYYIEKESGNAVIVVEPNKQERINNHPNFLTEDINRFIFPGKFSLGIVDNTSDRFERRKKDLLEQKYEQKTLLRKGVISKQSAMLGGNNEEKSAAKLFLQRDPETDEIINGQILIDPNISSSELEKILASKEVGDALISNDDSLLKSISIEELKKEAESYRFLSVLEKVVRDETKIKSFNDPENEYRGILRNVFINVKHLQDSFENVTTLGSALNLLLESFNSSAQIFKLVPMVNVVQNEGQIIFTNADFLPDFLPGTQDVYKFPIRTTESFVKSTNLQSDISSEGAKILLSQRYARQLVNSGNNVSVSVSNDIDKKTGANPTAQAIFDETNSERIAGEITTFEEGIPPYQFSQLNDSNFGQKDGDFTKELTMQDGIDFGVFEVEAQEKITKNIEKKNQQQEKTTETDIKFSIEFPGNYTPSGQLKAALKEQNAEETDESGFKQASPYDELGLLFLTNTMSMDGIGGIFPGNIYTSNYLPKKFQKEAYFFIQNASQTVDSSTWTTEITGRVLFQYKKQSGNLDRKDIAESIGTEALTQQEEGSGEIEVSVAPGAFGGDVEGQ
jgi:hypothetical protein